jgi:hypothetical protein
LIRIAQIRIQYIVITDREHHCYTLIWCVTPWSKVVLEKLMRVIAYLSTLYGVSGDLVLVLQDLIPEAISSQKCYMNMGPILNGYGAMDI